MPSSYISKVVVFVFMYPESFDYFSPKSLGEALELLSGGNSMLRVLAGGQSLIPSLKLRSFSLKGLVDITCIKELDYIRKDGQLLRIGALTTTATLENDSLIASALLILKEAAAQIADPLVRNMGTVGGNLSYADPANDLPAVMLVLNASMVATSKHRTRRISADSFFTDQFKTALKSGEILTEVEIPLQTDGFGSAYYKVRKSSGGFSIAGVASCLSVQDSRTISRCRIAMTAVGPKVLRAEKAEQALQGKAPTISVLDTVAEFAVRESHPFSDLYASENYKRMVLKKLVKEAVSASYERATRVG